MLYNSFCCIIIRFLFTLFYCSLFLVHYFNSIFSLSHTVLSSPLSYTPSRITQVGEQLANGRSAYSQMRLPATAWQQGAGKGAVER